MSQPGTGQHSGRGGQDTPLLPGSPTSCRSAPLPTAGRGAGSRGEAVTRRGSSGLQLRLQAGLEEGGWIGEDQRHPSASPGGWHGNTALPDSSPRNLFRARGVVLGQRFSVVHSCWAPWSSLVVTLASDLKSPRDPYPTESGPRPLCGCPSSFSAAGC